MKSWVRKTIGVGFGLLGGGLLLAASPSQALAADGGLVNVPVSVAANACGNGIGFLGGEGKGFSKNCEAKVINKDNSVEFTGPTDLQRVSALGGGGNGPVSTPVDGGLLGGGLVNVPVSVAANACGNGIGFLGGEGKGFSKNCEAKVINKGNSVEFSAPEVPVWEAPDGEPAPAEQLSATGQQSVDAQPSTASDLLDSAPGLGSGSGLTSLLGGLL